MTTETTGERQRAIVSIDTSCPRCGAGREPDQAYCLECGLALPPVTGRLPELRRRWLRRIGWYPGDWIWVSLLTLVVAAAGAAASILLSEHRAGAHGSAFTAVGNVTVAEPTVAAPTRSTTTLPTAPEPTTAGPATPVPGNGRLAWPRNTSGWTIVLVSYPKTTGHAAALHTAAQAARSGLPQVGVLDSSRFASLQPGYFVVFSGVYTSQTQANAAIPAVHQASFGAAYARPISR